MNKYKNICLALSFLLFGEELLAQSLEPRLYSNAPTGINFLIVGYNYSKGALATNTAIPLIDPKLRLNIGILAYATTYGLFGKSAKFNLIIPTVNIDGSAIFKGEYVEKNITGLGDIKAKVSVNLFGAPALTKKEFVKYKQDLIIGTSLEVTFPTGKYKKEKLVNIGTNRWAAKIGVGASKSLGDFTVELLVDAEFYTANNHFYVENKKEQEAIYSTQAHLIYNIKRGKTWQKMM